MPAQSNDDFKTYKFLCRCIGLTSIRICAIASHFAKFCVTLTMCLWHVCEPFAQTLQKHIKSHTQKPCADAHSRQRFGIFLGVLMGLFKSFFLPILTVHCSLFSTNTRWLIKLHGLHCPWSLVALFSRVEKSAFVFPRQKLRVKKCSHGRVKSIFSKIATNMRTPGFVIHFYSNFTIYIYVHDNYRVNFKNFFDFVS